ncbi:MAG: hypothetical protein AAF682_31760 [Planctomycetota bacterium]
MAAAFTGSGCSSGAGRSPSPYSIPEELSFWNPMSAQNVLAAEGVSNHVSYSSEPFLTLVIQELVPATQEWEQSSFTYSTSYNITDVASREGGRELYVAGIELHPDGTWDDVIERWVFPEVTGSHVAALDPPTTAAGVPRGHYSASLSIAGGTYVPHAERPRGQPTPTRTVLYSGTDYQHIDSLDVDPEGRSLLFHSYGLGHVYSLDLLGASPTVTLELSASENPHLTYCRSLGTYDHPVEGRFHLLRETNKRASPDRRGA